MDPAIPVPSCAFSLKLGFNFVCEHRKPGSGFYSHTPLLLSPTEPHTTCDQVPWSHITCGPVIPSHELVDISTSHILTLITLHNISININIRIGTLPLSPVSTPHPGM